MTAPAATGSSVPLSSAPFDSSYAPVATGEVGSASPFALYDDGLSDDGADTGRWESEPTGTRSEPRFYHPRFYAAYFDINVTDLATRLFRALLPYKPLLGWSDADEDQLDGTSVPDLYAPVWVTTTLVLALSMGAKCAEFLANVFRKKETTSLTPSISSVEFSRLWRAASVLYFYVFVFPVVLTLFQCLFAKHSITQSSVRSHPLVGTIMVYGYSMTPVVLGAFVATLPIRTAQIASMAVAFCIGAFVIMLNLWRDVSVQHRSLTYLVRLVAVLAHAAVGTALIFIFFLR
ncbi:unnamed protein product [Agarophyton chilense]|eukprot:gb/GEZJ01004696.1/.p1 GENE.gb/GEZJ01004696.1/~~gb/GEZJ01004696.1/.p1  ORF type:complete len:290 (-),score=25.51 gb/GEZJ01004696.1/:1260-2129(-)